MAVSFIVHVYDGRIRWNPPKSVDVYIYIYFLYFLSDIINVYTLIKYVLYTSSIQTITWNCYSNKIKSLKLINSSFKTNLCITIVWQVGERVKITYSLNKYGFCHRNVRIEKNQENICWLPHTGISPLFILLEGSSLDLIRHSFIFLLLISFYLFFFNIKRFSYISFQLSV